MPSYELFSKGYLEHFKLRTNSQSFSLREPYDGPGWSVWRNLINNFLKPNLIKTEEQKVKEKQKEVVEFLNLGHLTNELAGNYLVVKKITWAW